MTKKNRLIIFIVAALVLSGITIGIDARFFSSTRCNFRYYTLSSSKISANMSGMSIVCLSDIEYGTYMDKDRLSRIITKLNRMDPDVVIILGDLYDKNYSPNEQDREDMKELLGSLSATEGKFAVYGDYDQGKEEILAEDYFASGFEVLSNEVISLHHNTSDYIYLIALDYNIGDQITINDLYSNLNTDTYRITISHYPDVASLIPLNSTDIFVAGNGHSSQINFPLFNKADETGSTSFSTGLHYYNDFVIYASRGLGTTGTDARLFSDPELYFFRINN